MTSACHFITGHYETSQTQILSALSLATAAGHYRRGVTRDVGVVDVFAGWYHRQVVPGTSSAF